MRRSVYLDISGYDHLDICEYVNIIISSMTWCKNRGSTSVASECHLGFFLFSCHPWRSIPTSHDWPPVPYTIDHD